LKHPVSIPHSIVYSVGHKVTNEIMKQGFMERYF